MKSILTLLLAGGLALACNNNETELARTEAEKVKVEAELAKAQSQVELTKAQAQVELAKAQAQTAVAEAKAESAKAIAQAPSQASREVDAKPAEPDTFEVDPKVTVAVAERKPNGEPWDPMGGAPDVVVIVSANGAKVQSGNMKDRFNGQLELGMLSLKKGAQVTISVVDVDFSEHDPIGTGTVVFSGPGGSASFKGGSASGTVQF